MLHIIRIPPIKSYYSMFHLIETNQATIQAIGWKKKNKEPMLASINSNPLFQRKKAPAVETIPK